MCAAEQRGKRGSCPRAMFEGEYSRKLSINSNHEPEFCEWPAMASSGRNPEGAANPGRLFFGYFLLAKQKKVTCCRATPGISRYQQANVSFCVENWVPACAGTTVFRARLQQLSPSA